MGRAPNPGRREFFLTKGAQMRPNRTHDPEWDGYNATVVKWQSVLTDRIESVGRIC